MNPSSRILVVTATLASLAATPLLAVAADWQSVATACVPTRAGALEQVTVPTNGSFIRAKPAPGPNPPALNFVCNVDQPAAGPTSTWTNMSLDYVDALGGQVSATLYAKRKKVGAAVNLAQIVSVAGIGVRTGTVVVPPLNFATHHHYVLLSLQPQPATQPQLHAVALVE